jgi:hypothetical protein
VFFQPTLCMKMSDWLSVGCSNCRLSGYLTLKNNTCNLCIIGLCTLSFVHPSNLYPNVSTDMADEERALWTRKL